MHLRPQGTGEPRRVRNLGEESMRTASLSAAERCSPACWICLDVGPVGVPDVDSNAVSLYDSGQVPK